MKKLAIAGMLLASLTAILGISRLGEHHESVSYGCDLLQCNVGESFYCAEGCKR